MREDPGLGTEQPPGNSSWAEGASLVALTRPLTLNKGIALTELRAV